jgi:hypothetical protein
MFALDVPMTSEQWVALTFAGCNAVRVFAYLPQIMAIHRDDTGAEAISCTTWWLFMASNVTTVVYAIVVLGDHSMALLFALNTAGCAAILMFTAYKRFQLRARERTMAAWAAWSATYER